VTAEDTCDYAKHVIDGSITTHFCPSGGICDWQPCTATYNACCTKGATCQNPAPATPYGVCTTLSSTPLLVRPVSTPQGGFLSAAQPSVTAEDTCDYAKHVIDGSITTHFCPSGGICDWQPCTAAYSACCTKDATCQNPAPATPYGVCTTLSSSRLGR